MRPLRRRAGVSEPSPSGFRRATRRIHRSELDRKGSVLRRAPSAPLGETQVTLVRGRPTTSRSRPCGRGSSGWVKRRGTLLAILRLVTSSIQVVPSGILRRIFTKPPPRRGSRDIPYRRQSGRRGSTRGSTQQPPRFTSPDASAPPPRVRGLSGCKTLFLKTLES